MSNKTLGRITVIGSALGIIAIVLTSLCILEMPPFSPKEPVVCEIDAGICPMPDSGMEIHDANIGDSGLMFVNGPKDQKPFSCVTSDHYTYVHSHNHKNMSAHSQMKLDQSMLTLEDIDLLSKLTLDAWERKFDVDDQEAIDSYIDTVENLHVVYTDSASSFETITNGHFNNKTVATVMSNSNVCFKTPGRSDQFVLTLSPLTYDTNMSIPPSVYVIHEMVHLASLRLTGDIDKHHENTKLWIQHDNKRSVQAIAFRLYTEGR